MTQIASRQTEHFRAEIAEVGIEGMTVSDVKGFGRTGGKREVYRGAEYVVDFVPKTKLEIVVQEDKVRLVVEAIERGLEDVHAGRTVPHEQAMKTIRAVIERRSKVPFVP